MSLKIFHHLIHLFLCLGISIALANSAWAKQKQSWPDNLLAIVGDGAVLVVDHHDPQGAKELFAHNADRPYVPASILKIITTGVALEFLGPDYRFKTDFLLTKNNDLWIIGYGDPYLVSEELATIATSLQKLGLKEVRDLYIDNSYFEKDIILDGNTQTRSPYDAYNLAFGVNFNTFVFRKNKKGRLFDMAGSVPLTPLAKKVAERTKGSGTFRVSISENPQTAALHAGQLFKAHLAKVSIPVTGEIITDKVAPKERKVFYRHESTKPLEVALRDLMKYSNNFMTNQIFLVLGAEIFGPPANHQKAQLAMDAYFERHSLDRIEMGDGSGLSRLTTLTARQMAAVLAVVEKDRFLFTSQDDNTVYYKTGGMSDIKTLAGYMERPNAPEHPVSFVILLNGPKATTKAREQILDLLQKEVLPKAAPISEVNSAF